MSDWRNRTKKCSESFGSILRRVSGYFVSGDYNEMKKVSEEHDESTLLCEIVEEYAESV